MSLYCQDINVVFNFRITYGKYVCAQFIQAEYFLFIHIEVAVGRRAQASVVGA